MKITCVYCKNKIDLDIEFNKDFICSNCHSFYKIAEKDKKAIKLFAYPHKELRKDYAIRNLYLHRN
jgi:hypothetical protein